MREVECRLRLKTMFRKTAYVGKIMCTPENRKQRTDEKLYNRLLDNQKHPFNYIPDRTVEFNSTKHDLCARAFIF